MRRSLRDLNPNMVKKIDDYPGLPDELKEYCYWLADAGYVIMAIPAALMDKAWHAMEPEMYEVGIPVKYVLEKGYRKWEEYIVVDAPYNSEIGLVVDERYTEYE